MKFLLSGGKLEGGINLAVLACVMRTTKKSSTFFEEKSAPAKKILTTPMQCYFYAVNQVLTL